MHTSNEFVLHGGDTAFANRQRLLFDQLLIAEKQRNKDKSESEANDDRMEVNNEGKDNFQLPSRTGNRRETRRFRGKESLFKRPLAPAPKTNFRSIPDYHRNPHKWVKYSLDDVSTDEMTDRTNAQAAFSFLRELKARKSVEEKSNEEMDAEELESCTMRNVKVVTRPRKIKSQCEIKFQKSLANQEKKENTTVTVDDEDKLIFRSSKIILPEYVVGQKKKKSKKEKTTAKIDRTRQLRLEHLEEPDDSDES